MKTPRLLALTLISILGLNLTTPGQDPGGDSPNGIAVTMKSSPRPKSSSRNRSRQRRPQGDAPPDCPSYQTARTRRPPARSMPELFTRMGETFATDPARGMQTFLEELSRMEGPAMEGIRLSVEEERQAGKRARTEYLNRAASRGYRVADAPAKLKYIEELVVGFARSMRHRDRYPQIEVTLIEAPIPDGQSFPGGFLVFTTGLLDEPDEATVAGVVAHELAHLDRGHLYEYARRGKLADATFAQPGSLTFGPNDFNQFFTRQVALFGLLMNPYRPEHESEADCTSVTWLYLEGYDPRALVSFLERMHDRLRDQPANPFFSFGQSHPFSLQRRDEVLARLRQLQRWRNRDDLGLFAENLQRHVSRFHEREDR